MKLYQVFNGYLGNGAVHVLVIAEDEDRARELAREEFAAAGVTRRGRAGRRVPDSDYSDPANFSIEELCPDTAAEWASDKRD